MIRPLIKVKTRFRGQLVPDMGTSAFLIFDPPRYESINNLPRSLHLAFTTSLDRRYSHTHPPQPSPQDAGHQPRGTTSGNQRSGLPLRLLHYLPHAGHVRVGDHPKHGLSTPITSPSPLPPHRASRHARSLLLLFRGVAINLGRDACFLAGWEDLPEASDGEGG